MQLKPISAQGSRGLESYFKHLAARAGHDPWFNGLVVKMIELVQHLEQDVDGPPKWVTTSHVLFYISDEDSYNPDKAKVYVEPTEDGYKIQYRVLNEVTWPENGGEWDYSQVFAEWKANTVAEAGEMIIKALKLTGSICNE